MAQGPGARDALPCLNPGKSSGERASRSLLYPESRVLDEESESRLPIPLDVLSLDRPACMHWPTAMDSIAH